MDPRRRAWLTTALGTAAGAAHAAGAVGVLRTPFALALGSGSMHGLAHIGVMRACERAGLQP
jgi:predicted acylesterase/phospholipase RssA